MTHFQVQVFLFSVNARTSLLKNISLVSVVFKYFQNKNLKFLYHYRDLSYHERGEPNLKHLLIPHVARSKNYLKKKKEMILSTTYDNKTRFMFL